MVTQRLYLVRHGEVDNPDGILYGRLPGFGLTDRGHRMARLAADDLRGHGVPATGLVVSPLQRTRESAAPIAEAFGLEPQFDERIIEPMNRFEGRRMSGRYSALRRPSNWRHVWNPARPSWGEPYSSIRDRMRAAALDAIRLAEGGDVIMVSHQLPIWTVHRALARKPLAHNPRQRRCSLSSITILEYHPATGFREVGYREPAVSELAASTDQGAV
ncbi:histidine phosphatase family protein [Pseudoclavibacter endophyticus]|uniref:Histidine phosphatase family protein n=1 Tax=Pseudoclavibacter endophyticus TaxID=1778590 RepID=A0A6H9WQ67_9MICO|nr:histidine phosphatase family protein [Pseudoclavibacter endophyticus]KAB1648935.1 histidine phosphatase family protein [Pseudoclavibacter endophyticus]GGA67021.1 histidine phosphatase family protein [Pseudoclavibacter endophyticus]